MQQAQARAVFACCQLVHTWHAPAPAPRPCLTTWSLCVCAAAAAPSPPVPGLPRFAAYCEAVAAHPAVAGSMAPPDSSKSWTEQLVDNYKVYVARRKAAAN